MSEMPLTKPETALIVDIQTPFYSWRSFLRCSPRTGAICYYAMCDILICNLYFVFNVYFWEGRVTKDNVTISAFLCPAYP